MGYRSLQACVADLERTGQLRRVDTEVDPHLEMAEIQRRLYRCGGPAVLFTRPRGCRFPMVCNLFGTLERTRFLFRDTLDAVRHLVELKVDPSAFWKQPWRYRDVPRSLWNLRPRFVNRGPVLDATTTIGQLPQLKCWPNDGGAFITLPVVYTEDANRPGWRHSNLGMYRVQLSGGDYLPDRQVGLHYQIHRGIGMHHAAAIEKGVPFRVTIGVGGPPALTLAAVMPLPEGLPELAFAGALGGRRVRLIQHGNGLPIFADADFCITGTVEPDKLLPEGPFGDHLGYYSLAHPYPVLNVESVHHRKDAIWPLTVVGRPPQEDTSFGAIIHELTGPIIPTVIPGVHAVHAVDAAGVHPLLLAIGSERYVPFAARRKPQELLTIANAILGQGQLSLAKYLLITAHEDNPDLDIRDIPAFFRHALERVDWRTDLHFQTCTTIDTLDYSGDAVNEGSKLVFAAVGPAHRKLPKELAGMITLPEGFEAPKVCLPGILAVRGPAAKEKTSELRKLEISRLIDGIASAAAVTEFPLIVVVDNTDFVCESINNFLWVVFTRSNPAADVFGVGEFLRDKHWGCTGSLIIDARIKPQHAPPLEEDPAVSKRVDELTAKGGPLHGLFS
jgi:4-hydroxy-3-polyprenylbenzoate decarboxylase